MQGYLQIWKGFIPHWNRYYFRIHEQLLLFGPTKQQIQGKIHLKIAQIVSKLDDPISLMINTGTETIDIRAYSIDEKVKWFKKLKQVQKQAIDNAHNKQLFKMKVELSKVNRFKILDDLNTEIWKCHAELEQKLEEVLQKVKNVQVLKSIDRLRISCDQFKYKTSQILQYIDQEIRDLKNRDKDQSKSQKTYSKRLKTGYQNDFQEQIDFEDTQYYSFSHDQTQNRTKKSAKQKNKRMESIREQDSSSVSSLSRKFIQRRSIYQTPKSKYNYQKFSQQDDDEIDENHLKSKLLKKNKVFQKYKNNIISLFDSRQSLPSKFTPQEKFSVISTFTTALTSGTDLTKITWPITLNQPISTLQKGCQQMFYCQLLSRADNNNDENMRILYVAAFVVSGHSLNEFRVKKSFAPLLGETFQYIDETKGYQFLAQHVSDQPPISAYYIRSDSYQIFDNSRSNVSFVGNGIKTTPQSKTIIKLQKNNDMYVITKPYISLSNIIFGKTWIDIFGEITIKCKEFNTEVYLQFQQESFWRGTQTFRIVGNLQSNGKKVYSIDGYLNKQLIAENISTKQKIVLWKKTHQVLKDYYNFNELSIQLNNLTAHGFKNLPPTDSRLRPDQRALEYRDMDLATEEKQRLEEKQRKRKKQNETSKQSHKILWFKETILQSQDVFISNDKYWNEKIKGSWKESLDIF